MRSILDILPVWNANPTSDFTSVADSPQLFEFVSAIRSSGEQWVFPFDTAQDIVGILRTQLAYLFADALELRTRAARLGIEKYKDLSGRELRLVIERPRGWEYLLFSEALVREIAGSADLKRDWSYGVAFGSSTSASLSNFLHFIPRKTAEAIRIFSTFNILFNDALPAAFDPQGQPGDPEAIVYVANRVGAIYRAALQWKLDFLCVSVDEQLLKLRSLAAGLCDNAVAEVEAFAGELLSRISDALNAPTPEGSRTAVNLTLVLTVPDQTELNQELERLTAMVVNGELQWQ